MQKKKAEGFLMAISVLLFFALIFFVLWLSARLPIIAMFALLCCATIAFIARRTNLLNVSDKVRNDILVGCGLIAIVAGVILISKRDSTMVFVSEVFLEGKRWSKQQEVVTDEGSVYYEDRYYFTPYSSSGKTVQEVLYFLLLFYIASTILICLFLYLKEEPLDRYKFPEKLPVILQIIVAVIIAIGILNLPYLYYRIERWVVFLLLIRISNSNNRKRNLKRLIAYTFLGTLFNPLEPVHFDKWMHQIIDAMIVLVVFIDIAIQIKENKKTELRIIEEARTEGLI